MKVGAVKAPTTWRSQVCKRSRQSVSISPSRYFRVNSKLPPIEYERCCSDRLKPPTKADILSCLSGKDPNRMPAGAQYVPLTRQCWSFPRLVRWRLNTTECKRSPHPTPRTCGLDVWWFWPRRHHQLVSYPLRIRRRLAWSCCPTDEPVRATWPAPTLRWLRQRQQ